MISLNPQEYHSTFPAFSTGVRHLDELLLDGLRPGTILNIAGAAGTGKSQLALTIAVHLAKQRLINHVFWIDTENKFSPERLVEISGPADNRILESVSVASARDLSEVATTITQLASLAREMDLFSVLIIDSISAAVKNTKNSLGDTGSAGKSIPEDLESVLHGCSKFLKIITVVTSHASASVQRRIESSPRVTRGYMDSIVDRICHQSIWLEKSDDQGHITLRHSRSSTSSSDGVFSISHQGIICCDA